MPKVPTTLTASLDLDPLTQDIPRGLPDPTPEELDAFLDEHYFTTWARPHPPANFFLELVAFLEAEGRLDIFAPWNDLSKCPEFHLLARRCLAKIAASESARDRDEAITYLAARCYQAGVEAGKSGEPTNSCEPRLR